jgi:hypothetical protein
MCFCYLGLEDKQASLAHKKSITSLTMPVLLLRLQALYAVIVNTQQSRAAQVRGKADAYTTGNHGTFPSETVRFVRATVDGFIALHQHLRSIGAGDMSLHAVTTLYLEHNFAVGRVKGTDAHKDLQQYLQLRVPARREALKAIAMCRYSKPKSVHTDEYYAKQKIDIMYRDVQELKRQLHHDLR